MAELAIQVHGLQKSYGQTQALRGIDLHVLKGEVFALLGPNGAGKTTLVEILEGHRHRSAGQIDVLGYDPARNDRRFKERVGIVLQTTGVEPYLTVEETIELYRAYYPHPRPVQEILEITGLTEQRRVKVLKLSGGQLRRLDVAVGLAGDPELLFLDEPTSGFDPSARRNAWQIIKSLQSLGKTVLLTTHYMDEAQHLADRVAVIAKGKIVAEGTPNDLIRLNPMTTIKLRLLPGQEELFSSFPGVMKVKDEQLTIQTATPTRTLFELTSLANEQGIELQDLTVSRPSLEDIYLELVQGIDTAGSIE